MGRDDKDDEGTAFRLYLDVPDQSDADQEKAIAWLNQLAAQLAEVDGKNLAIKVTGRYDDDYPSDDDGSREQNASVAEEPGTAEAKTFSAPACSSKKAVVEIMVCPGRRPYT
jgi:hypothetical protein